MNELLPEHIGGYQCLVDDEIIREGDIFVRDGKPTEWAKGAIGCHVASRPDGCNIYRRIPVAKQGGDPAKWEEAEEAIRNQPPQPIVPLKELAGTSGNYMPTDAAKRKAIPIYSGLLKYFPRAVAAVAEVSRIGNEQHNPGQPLHWDRSKSGDELDAAARHMVEAGKFDKDGTRHSAKLAWRAMSNLEKELEDAEK